MRKLCRFRTLVFLLILPFVMSTSNSKKSYAQILTGCVWEIKELYQIIPDHPNPTHYLRLGENTTGSNLDIVRFLFKADGTGFNVSTNRVTYRMSWKFINAAETRIRLVIDTDDGTRTFIWNIMDLFDGMLYQTTTDRNFMVTAKLIPNK